ncbi:hypothetical protein HK104_003664, partial [Borealophlyctis nickersoniae]
MSDAGNSRSVVGGGSEPMIAEDAGEDVEEAEHVALVEFNQEVAEHRAMEDDGMGKIVEDANVGDEGGEGNVEEGTGDQGEPVIEEIGGSGDQDEAQRLGEGEESAGTELVASEEEQQHRAPDMDAEHVASEEEQQHHAPDMDTELQVGYEEDFHAQEAAAQPQEEEEAVKHHPSRPQSARGSKLASKNVSRSVSATSIRHAAGVPLPPSRADSTASIPKSRPTSRAPSRVASSSSIRHPDSVSRQASGNLARTDSITTAAATPLPPSRPTSRPATPSHSAPPSRTTSTRAIASPARNSPAISRQASTTTAAGVPLPPSEQGSRTTTPYMSRSGSAYHVAAGVPLPPSGQGSRTASPYMSRAGSTHQVVATARTEPQPQLRGQSRPVSRAGSAAKMDSVSAAASVPLPPSAPGSRVGSRSNSSANVARAASRGQSLAGSRAGSAVHIPLKEAAAIPLPESRTQSRTNSVTGSRVGSAAQLPITEAAAVPLPESKPASIAGSRSNSRANLSQQPHSPQPVRRINSVTFASSVPLPPSAPSSRPASLAGSRAASATGRTAFTSGEPISIPAPSPLAQAIATALPPSRPQSLAGSRAASTTSVRSLSNKSQSRNHSNANIASTTEQESTSPNSHVDSTTGQAAASPTPSHSRPATRTSSTHSIHAQQQPLARSQSATSVRENQKPSANGGASTSKAGSKAGSLASLHRMILDKSPSVRAIEGILSKSRGGSQANVVGREMDVREGAGNEMVNGMGHGQDERSAEQGKAGPSRTGSAPSLGDDNQKGNGDEKMIHQVHPTTSTSKPASRTGSRPASIRSIPLTDHHHDQVVDPSASSGGTTQHEKQKSGPTSQRGSRPASVRSVPLTDQVDPSASSGAPTQHEKPPSAPTSRRGSTRSLSKEEKDLPALPKSGSKASLGDGEKGIPKSSSRASLSGQTDKKEGGVETVSGAVEGQ